jgi:hypothetical protein
MILLIWGDTGMEEGKMTLLEAAAYAKLSKGLLARRLREQVITGEKFGPMWMVDKASLDAFLASERKPGVRTGTKRQPRKPKVEGGT